MMSLNHWLGAAMVALSIGLSLPRSQPGRRASLSKEPRFALGGYKDVVWCAAFSPDGKLFAVAGWDGMVYVWGTATETTIRELGGPKGGILALAFTPDGKYLLDGSDPGLLQLWEVAEWQELGRVLAHKSQVPAIAFSPDGKLMAPASHDCTVKIWDAP